MSTRFSHDNTISMDTSNPELFFGKRIVNYLKNEALVGRIGKQKIQVFPKHYMYNKESKD